MYPPPPVPAGTSNVTPAADGTILPGRVVDPYNPPPNSTYIRWGSLEENKEIGTPIDVTVGPDGYFTTPALRAGGQYKLTARPKQGDKLLAGTTYAQAPNVRVVIQVREALVTASTPPLPTPNPGPGPGPAPAAAPNNEKKDEPKNTEQG